MTDNGKPHATTVVLLDESPVKSYKVGVKTVKDETWVYNALRFYVADDANSYARDLLRRWPAIHSVAVHGCEDKPNATFPVPSDRYPVKDRG